MITKEDEKFNSRYFSRYFTPIEGGPVFKSKIELEEQLSGLNSSDKNPEIFEELDLSRLSCEHNGIFIKGVYYLHKKSLKSFNDLKLGDIIYGDYYGNGPISLKITHIDEENKIANAEFDSDDMVISSILEFSRDFRKCWVDTGYFHFKKDF